MNWNEMKKFFKKRSSMWTMGLCMMGLLVLGGIAAVNQTRKPNPEQMESEMGKAAFLDENGMYMNDAWNDEDAAAEELAAASAEGKADVSNTETEEPDASVITDTDGSETAVNTGVDGSDSEADEGTEESGAAATASSNIISEEILLAEGIAFSQEESLMWPSAGTILLDYSMDSSIYFPTLNQYKYNPALVIGSAVGNQVLAAAKGIVESVYIDEETGTTLVLNIGNGYKLTYGQLKELAAAEGDVVETGEVLGYVSEPTKYYTEEGGNLYFKMTKDESPVDPILYLE